jgi:uncharacterized OsmC-like protein
MKNLEPEVFLAYAKVLWDGKTGGQIKTRKRTIIKVDIPKEFKGLGRYPCPDELFISSIAACLLTTFLYFKKKMRLKILNLSVEGKGKISRKVDGYKLEDAWFKFTVVARKKYEEAIMQCLNLAEEYCHLLNLLPIKPKVEKTFKFL